MKECARSVAQYLCAGSSPESAGNVSRFLQKLDEFDLEEYISSSILSFSIRKCVLPLKAWYFRSSNHRRKKGASSRENQRLYLSVLRRAAGCGP